jgi:putative aldouronate transport system substrate-binding protein
MKTTKNFKNLIALILAVLLVIAMATSCGKKTDPSDSSAIKDSEKSADPSQDPKLDKSEYYEILLYQDTHDPKYDEFKDQNYFRNVLKEKFNFGFVQVGYPGDTLEKLALMLSAGDYPDLLRIPDVRYLKAYVEAEALIELEPLMDKYGPNIKKRHEERIPYWKTMSGLDDGKVWFYTFGEPSYTYGISSPVNEWKFRSDILEQQGYPNMVDEDDIYEVIKQGIKDNPQTVGKPTIGFSHPLASWGTDGLMCLTNTYDMGRLDQMTRKYGSVWDPDQNKFMNVAEDYSYKEGLLFFNKLWRDGLFDKDSITDNYEAFTKKMEEGRVLCTFFYNWGYAGWNEKLERAGQEVRYIPYPAMMKSQVEKGETKIYSITNGEVWSSNTITKNAKYPERLMEVIDWCHTDEGLVAAGWGEEGVQYTIKDGKRVPTAEHLEKSKNDPNYKYTWVGEGAFGLFGGLDDNGQAFRMTSDNEYIRLTMDSLKFFKPINFAPKIGFPSLYWENAIYKPYSGI